MLITFSAQTEAKTYVEMHCFAEEAYAKSTIAFINHSYASRIPRSRNQHNFAWKNRARDEIQKAWPKIELITDTKDKYGRTYCLVVEDKKLNDQDTNIIGKFQRRETGEINLKNQILARGLKDPWGGEKLERNGKQKALRSCRKSENPKAEELECDDLIVTARNGDDNVIEYRFWLGFQSGEGFVVYKSPSNNVELSKVMASLKKDKKEHAYSFGPQGCKDAYLIPDAKISGDE